MMIEEDPSFGDEVDERMNDLFELFLPDFLSPDDPKKSE